MMMPHYMTQFVGASAARVVAEQGLHLAFGALLLGSGGVQLLGIAVAWLGHGHSSVGGFT
jgi:hypothetical protein